MNLYSLDSVLILLVVLLVIFWLIGYKTGWHLGWYPYDVYRTVSVGILYTGYRVDKMLCYFMC